MKKKIFLWTIVTLILICFFLYLYSFTNTNVSNLYLTVDYENPNGWEISGAENGEEVALTASQAIDYTETVFLRRTVTEDWGSYSRIYIDTGRAVLIFVDNNLVFTNHQTELSQPGELTLMQKPQDQPFSLVLSVNPAWVGKTMTIVTRLYENEPYGSIGFDLVNDNVFLLQHEAWVNQKALPGAMFGTLFLLFMGLFLFEFSIEKKGYPLLFLASASLLQMLCYMSVLSGNPLPMIDSSIGMALYFLFPLLYLGTKLTHSKKTYFIAILSIWSVYFTLFVATFILYLPVPYWFDKVDVLCFILLGIMLYYCFKERQKNLFLRHFLSLLGMFCAGYILLFLVVIGLNIPLSQIMIAIFKEALNLYCRPLLFWIFTTLLIALFILAVWDLIQEKIYVAKQMEQIQSQQVILNLQIGAAKDQLDSLRTTNEQTLVYRHDMRHHFAFISSCIAEGNTNKIRDYVTQVQGELDILTPLRFCENETVSLILSFFAEKGEKVGITLWVDAELPKHLALPDTELCAVLSNGLENAIAAAALVSDGDKTLRVSCKIEEDKLLLFIQNTCVGKTALEKGLPKATRDGHGFGAKSIASIVEKRKGYLSCEAEDNRFTLWVVLPLDK